MIFRMNFSEHHSVTGIYNKHSFLYIYNFRYFVYQLQRINKGNMGVIN